MIYWEVGKESRLGFLKLLLSAIGIGGTQEKMQSVEVNLCPNLRQKQSSITVQAQPLPWSHDFSYTITIIDCKICGEKPCGKDAQTQELLLLELMTYTLSIYTVFRDLILDQGWLSEMLLVLREKRRPGCFTSVCWFYAKYWCKTI